MIVEMRTEADADEQGSGLLKRLRARPRWRFVLAAVTLCVAAIGVILAMVAQLGVGPLAAAAPPTWAYLAAAASPTDPAHLVVVVDVATGTRRVFTAGARVLDLTLSADRRRLFVASDDGRIFVLDPVRGTVRRVLHAAARDAVLYVVPLDESRLLAVLDSSPGATLVVLDINNGDHRVLELGQRVAGRPVVDGQIHLPVAPIRADGGRSTISSSVLTISPETLIITDETTLARDANAAFSLAYLGTPRLPPILLASALGIVDFDPGTLLLARLNADGPRILDIAQVHSRSRQDRLFLSDLWGDAEVAADGRVVHICVGQPGGSSGPNVARQRYVVPVDTLEPVTVGDDCGVFTVTGDGTLMLAGGDRVEVLDPRSGRVKDTITLRGYLVRTD